MVAGNTLAGIATRVVSAGSSVLAGAGGALIHLVLAVAACVASLTAAVVCVASIHAEPTIPAQLGDIDGSLLRSLLTGHAGHITVEASPASGALTAVQRFGLPALAAILAG